MSDRKSIKGQVYLDCLYANLPLLTLSLEIAMVPANLHASSIESSMTSMYLTIRLPHSPQTKASEIDYALVSAPQCLENILKPNPPPRTPSGVSGDETSPGCWNFRCDLVGNLRIHPTPHSCWKGGTVHMYTPVVSYSGRLGARGIYPSSHFLFLSTR